MNIHYWPVGATTEQATSLTFSEMSRYLLADWLPSLPVNISQSIFGWPQHVLCGNPSSGPNRYLSVRSIVGQSERHWKTVLSWMMGVIGTRKVMSNEGYRWIAPASAFYPNTQAEFNIRWLTRRYPQSKLRIFKSASAQSNLLPDYIAAARQPDGSYSFALFESKGTNSQLQNIPCKPAWRNQVNSADVTFDGAPLPIARRVVVATRFNPNAVRAATRELQIRAWNSEQNTSSRDTRIVLGIVAAHYISIFQNLGLATIAHGLAMAAQLRHSNISLESVLNVPEYSRPILEARGQLDRLYPENPHFRFNASQMLRSLVKNLLDTNTQTCVHALSVFEESIDLWKLRETESTKNEPETSIDATGFTLAYYGSRYEDGITEEQ